MATNANPSKEAFRSSVLLVPAVALADLKTIWAMKNEFQIRHPGRPVSISVDAYERACSPRADFHAVFSRLSMLETVQRAAEAGHFKFPWIQNGQPEEIVFRIVSTIPMVAPQAGLVREGFPIDVEELIRQIENESSRGTRE